MSENATAKQAATDEGADGGRWISSRVGGQGLRADIQARSFAFVADEPVPQGGGDTGPTPYEYLLAALGGCMAITLRMYASRKGWPLTGVEIRLRSAHSHEPDCESCPTREVDVGRVERTILLEGPLDDQQRLRLRAIADRCPVKQTLARGITISDVP